MRNQELYKQEMYNFINDPFNHNNKLGYYVKQIQHLSYERKDKLLHVEVTFPIITICSNRYGQEHHIVFDKNINKILKCYGFKFKFSKELIKRVCDNYGI